jgi:squalene-associated FAD-dependent desaturase
MPNSAIVLGAGFAGMAAAVELAVRGWRVTVLEKTPRLGGRASSFTDRATGDPCDNGQHLLIAGYRNTRALLDRTGAAKDVRFQDAMDVTFALPGGETFPFKASARLPAPLHLLPAFLGHPLLGLRERVAAARAGSAALLMSERDLRALEPVRFSDWLKQQGQPQALIDAFWEVLTLATINAPTTVVSTYPILKVFRLGFLASADAARLGYATVPLGRLLEPAADLVRAHGGEVRLRAKAAAIEGGAVRLEGGETLRADAVVSALPFHALRALRPELVPDGLRSAPIVDVHVWLDRAVTDAQFVALLGARAAQWVWNRGRMVEGCPREGAMLSVTISGAEEALALSPREVEGRVLEDFRRFFPRMAGATVRRVWTIKEPHATLRLEPGMEKLRPAARTADARLVLAGDWTDTGLPSTIEGAVLSGFRAAEVLTGKAIVRSLDAGADAPVRLLRRVIGG